jgi:hypothetical protein
LEFRLRRNVQAVVSVGGPASLLAVDFLTNPEIWIAFVTLAILEIVLGIDNIIFITVLNRGSSLRRNGGRARSSASRWQWACGYSCCCRSIGSAA